MSNQGGQSGVGSASTGSTGSQQAGGGDLRSNLQDKGRAAVEQGREQYEQLRDTAQQYLEEGRERAGEYMEQGREMAQQYLDEGRERAADLQQSLERQIREQPMRSVLTAAGIGFVLGIFFMRR